VFYKFSRYVHLIEVGGGVFALWNSLWLRTLFVSGTHLKVTKELFGGVHLGSDELLNSDIADFLEALNSQKFFVSAEDEKKVCEVRQLLTHQPIGILYLIMTEGCNLACRYCFLSDMVQRGRVLGKMMPPDIAFGAIDRFQALTKLEGVEAPEIIFYGGEPLLNWQVMREVLGYARLAIPTCGITVNTNGTLITEGIATILKEFDVGVSLSCDGKTNDENRVTPSGKGSLRRILRGLEILQKHGVQVAISCTITNANVDRLDQDFLWFANELGVDAVDFNIMLGHDLPTEDYGLRAAKKLVECFELSRSRGVRIERVMRRVTPFAEGRLSLVDCGGCGQQVVCAPDGRIGCCHAFLNDGSFFFQPDEVPNPQKHSLWKSWKQRSPFNISECLKCEALGICGGGCFYNAYVREGTVWNPDRTHCAHAKEMLKFLLKDMWKSMEKENEQN